MALVFIDGEHEKKFREALIKAESTNSNISLQVALYVLTAVPNLANKLDQFVSFQRKCLTPEVIDRVNLSQGERVMAGLAINLFNGYEITGIPTSPARQISLIDKSLKRVYLSAIEYRFVY